MNRVWLHGFTGSDETFAALASGDTRSLLFGHGGADIPAPTCFDDEVDRVAATLGAKTHLIGYSLGGRVALGIAARHPERIARLTLVSTNPGLVSADARADRARDDDALAARLDEDGLKSFVQKWEAMPMFETERLSRSAAARLRRIRTSHDSHQLAHALRILSLGRMPSRWEALPRLTMPVDLVVGERDAKFLDLAHHMAPLLTQRALHVIPDVAHDVPSHAPADLWALVYAASTAATRMSQRDLDEPKHPTMTTPKMRPQ